MLLLSSKKTGNINASFISIKCKNKIYRHKRSTNIFSDKNLNKLLDFVTTFLDFVILIVWRYTKFVTHKCMIPFCTLPT